LYLTIERFADDDDMVAQYLPLFEDIQPLGTVPLERGGEITEVVHLFKGRTSCSLTNIPIDSLSQITV
jgi:hypothetical protein